MSFINIEIKAKAADAAFVRNFLKAHGAVYKGTDHQTDTYFNVPKGRLKLRQGNIENTLIYYERANEWGPKQSNCNLAPVTDGAALKEVLTGSLGIKVIVEKQREIYFIDNVKFHIDMVQGLGDFVEIEASDRYSPLPVEKLRAQCDYYMQAFGITASELVHVSYSDMLLDKTGMPVSG